MGNKFNDSLKNDLFIDTPYNPNFLMPGNIKTKPSLEDEDVFEG
jgi:hypothetical protein